MLIAVIGGRLQGVEAAYLAQKAGYKTLVIDKSSDAPAVGLCDQFMEFEFSSDTPFPQCDSPIDLILPAIEDDRVLSFIQMWSQMEKIPLAFDLEAYSVSNSKVNSDALFRKMNLPAPKPWPDCGFPVVIKPDQASGSHGVEIIGNQESLFERFPTQKLRGSRIIQEFIKGPSYSIEVMGYPGNYCTFQVTDLGMDTDYDCKNVTAPTKLSENQIGRFKEMAIAIAEELELAGIMDLEVILHENKLKLLEIDARFPSQTPMAVYGSTGVNMVEKLVALTNRKGLRYKPRYERSVLVEHIKVSGSKIEFRGEHMMAQDGPLYLIPHFFGADEAITSFSEQKSQWVATLIFTGASRDEIAIKRDACYERIVEQAWHTVREKAL